MTGPAPAPKPPDTGDRVAVVATILLIAGVAVFIAVKRPPPQPRKPAAENAEEKPTAKLEWVDLAEGTGPAVQAGQRIRVHYTGWLADGKKFDSSHDRDRGQPFPFTLGRSEVIQGWDQGVAGMKVGGKRKLTIPPHLAYGRNGRGSIPPNATLVFEVELVGIE